MRNVFSRNNNSIQPSRKRKRKRSANSSNLSKTNIGNLDIQNIFVEKDLKVEYKDEAENKISDGSPSDHENTCEISVNFML